MSDGVARSGPDREAPGPLAGRLVAVDGLRAIAVGVVFAHHGYHSQIPGGHIGVDLFFVISGFVITRALVSDGIDCRRFYTHRFFRILPPVIPVLTFVGVISLAGIPLASLNDILLSLFSVLNWARAFEYTDGGYLGHFWSLGVEEQFYLLWPLALAGLLTGSSRRLVLVSIGALVAASIVWQLFLVSQSLPHARIYNGLDTRISQLLIGCLLFFLLPLRSIPRPLFVAASIALLVLVFAMKPDSDFYRVYGITLVAVLSAIVVGFAASNRGGILAPLEWNLTQWVGRRSYAIYLWHWPLLGFFDILGDTLGWRHFVEVLLAIGSTVLASELSYRLVERPAFAIRDGLDRTQPVKGLGLERDRPL